MTPRYLTKALLQSEPGTWAVFGNVGKSKKLFIRPIVAWGISDHISPATHRTPSSERSEYGIVVATVQELGRLVPAEDLLGKSEDLGGDEFVGTIVRGWFDFDDGCCGFDQRLIAGDSETITRAASVILMKIRSEEIKFREKLRLAKDN